LRRTGGAHALLALQILAGIVGTWPRPDVWHLTYISAPAWALTVAWFAPLARRTVGQVVLAPLAIVAVAYAAFAGWTIARARPLASPVGQLRVAAEDEPGARALLAAVRPGDSLYVHPYLPIAYFLTQGLNPSRYPYLGPGMMDRDDEQRVIASLRANPPQWVLHLPVTREGFLSVFPSGEGRDYRFEEIELWIAENYEEVPVPRLVHHRLMRRKHRLP
jgi:hypothetical protein